jgi:hypothetical protein
VLAEGILTAENNGGTVAYFTQLSVVLSGATGISIEHS